MDYIKYIKDYNTKRESKKYKSIEYNEFNILIKKSNSIPFSNSEISYLKKVLSEKGFIYQKYKSDPIIIHANWIIEILNTKKHINRIFKLNDDYYYVLLGSYHGGSYFKCDQLDGLLDCLNGILI